MIAIVQDIASTILLVLGALLVLTAGIGVVRLPDVYMRMSATSKASSLGCGLVLLGTAISQADLGITIRVIAAILFLFLTAPVASHLIGRAAYRLGIARWQGTVVDDFQAYEDQRQRSHS
jgi:multicomponent Na+:H+ antiporter subunit G